MVIKNIPCATACATDASGNSGTVAGEVTDKLGYARRWLFSPRHIDNLLAQGMPHLKVGSRRVRIVVAEADAWMKERFSTQRHGAARKKAA